MYASRTFAQNIKLLYFICINEKQNNDVVNCLVFLFREAEPRIKRLFISDNQLDDTCNTLDFLKTQFSLFIMHIFLTNNAISPKTCFIDQVKNVMQQNITLFVKNKGSLYGISFTSPPL